MAGPVVKSMPGIDVVTLPSLIGAPVAFWPLPSPQSGPAVAGLSPTRPPESSGAVVSAGAVVSSEPDVSAGAAVVSTAAVVSAGAAEAGAALAGAAVPLVL